MTSCKFVVAAVIGSVLVATAAADPPPVFSGRGYDEAKIDAETAGTLFLVSATASWCAPCKQMDRTTWIDPRVVEWIGDHTFAVRVDVDRDRAHATPLNIRAMPTVIVFREGREFDRVIGYRSADELLSWLDGVCDGRREIDALREAAGDRAGADGRVDVRARLNLARTLAHTGEAEEAAAEFVWLWENMLDHRRSMVGVRLSFMVSDMKRLAEKHEVAMEAFTKLRDRYGVKVENGTADRDKLNDWLHLNKVIDNEGATLQWFEKVKDDSGYRASINDLGRSLFPLLLWSGRWIDAGRLYTDPVGQARRRVKSYERKMPKRFRQRLSLLYAACLAADRLDEADGVAAVLLVEQDNGAARVTLIETALRAEQPRRNPHLRWLDEAETLGEPVGDLRRRLTAALDRRRR